MLFLSRTYNIANLDFLPLRRYGESGRYWQKTSVTIQTPTAAFEEQPENTNC